MNLGSGLTGAGVRASLGRSGGATPGASILRISSVADQGHGSGRHGKKLLEGEKRFLFGSIGVGRRNTGSFPSLAPEMRSSIVSTVGRHNIPDGRPSTGVIGSGYLSSPPAARQSISRREWRR